VRVIKGAREKNRWAVVALNERLQLCAARGERQIAEIFAIEMEKVERPEAELIVRCRRGMGSVQFLVKSAGQADTRPKCRVLPSLTPNLPCGRCATTRGLVAQCRKRSSSVKRRVHSCRGRADCADTKR
jgi:hypothetical protein